jgi:hypothetical protein
VFVTGFATLLASDYNDLFTLAEPLAYNNGTELADLSLWQTFTGGDYNSVSVNPGFASAFDLHTLEPMLDNMGTYIWGIDYDLDLNPITDPPDMGCYQFSTGSAKTLNLNVFLEGLYNGPSSMAEALDGTTGLPAWGSGIADKITVQLHHATAPYGPAGSWVEADLAIDGWAQFNFTSVSSSPHYIEVMHRNSVGVWSAIPVSFADAVINYDFTAAQSAAFGDMLKDLGGVFALYAGDANQDGVVDGYDLIDIDNDAANAVIGYMGTDLNGDGNADTFDVLMAEANASLFAATSHP